jgi:hypothetical protein
MYFVHLPQEAEDFTTEIHPEQRPQTQEQRRFSFTGERLGEVSRLKGRPEQTVLAENFVTFGWQWQWPTVFHEK